MKIFQPELEDQDEGYATSFTFDSVEEQHSFANFLDNLEVGYLKSKFPVVEDGKFRYQTGFIVPVPKNETPEESEKVETEVHDVQDVQDVQEFHELQENIIVKKKSRKSN